MWFERWREWWERQSLVSTTGEAAISPVVEDTPAHPVGLDLQTGLRQMAGVGIESCHDIHCNAAQLPRIRLTCKPSHQEYLSVKIAYRDQAMAGLMEYAAFVQQLDGLEGVPELQNMVVTVICNFVVRYWDMPCSKNNHHDYPWGHCLHSLEVGCAEAQQAVSWMPMSVHGMDNIAKSRFRGLVVLGHFVKGLMHDAYKYYQYTPSGTGKERVTFSPYLTVGNMLDFKIACPIDPAEDWNPLLVDAGKLNMIEFYLVIPPELGACIPYTEMVRNLQVLLGSEPLKSDHESAARDLARRRGGDPNAGLNRAVQAYFQQAPGRVRPALNVFRLNETWTAVDATLFFGRITSPDGFTDISSLQRYLTYTGTLKSDGSNGEMYTVKLPFLHRKESKSGETTDVIVRTKTLAFLRTAFLKPCAGDSFISLGQALFREEDKEHLSVLLADLPDCFTDVWPEPKNEGKNIPQETEEPDGAPQTPVLNQPALSAPDVQPELEKTPPAADVSPVQIADCKKNAVQKHVVPNPVETDPVLEYAVSTGLAAVDWGARLALALRKRTAIDMDLDQGWLFYDDMGCFLKASTLLAKLLPVTEGVNLELATRYIQQEFKQNNICDITLFHLTATHPETGEVKDVEGECWQLIATNLLKS